MMPIGSKRGFTLIETIFSTLFIGVTILAIVNLFPGAYLSIRKSETQLQADIVAKSVVDEVRLLSFRELDPDTSTVAGAWPSETRNGITYHEFPQVGPPFDPWVVEGITYVPKVEIYEVPDADTAFLKGVRVTVSYRLQLSEKTLIHETYLHKLIR